ncbi:SPOC like C-terminal domain-containing protein [Roridomyces roridus]|uniref:ATP-dependent DNA helicase II subunit 2 n=1 Tax=Roridomyces roridus TaxID=1738132 RepID=A0AAD7F8T6_9AGAR|nr:SPOC like C-terminal domain-containing protein [Roridomyces roridus]
MNQGGYERIEEYIPIAQPSAGTLARLDALEPTDEAGDPLDALIVAIETQVAYLGKKKWTRNIVVVTDGENPIEVKDLDGTVSELEEYGVNFTVIGIDFDDATFPSKEQDKSPIKVENESWYTKLNKEDRTYAPTAFIGTCALALREIRRPDIKVTGTTLTGTTLRLGDNDSRPDKAMQINIKTRSETDSEDEKMDVDEDENGVPKEVTYVQLERDTEYYVDPRDHNSDEEDVKMEEPDEDEGLSNKVDPALEQVDKDDRVRGFKYGTTYVPCPDGRLDRLPTKHGIDICGFFPKKNFRRELAMGEVQYIWGDPDEAVQQVAISSITQAMYEKGVMAIARWVPTDDKDPKMGVLSPCIGTDVDCLLWVGMPFADDVRKYTFASLDHLVSKKGEEITEHPYIPTENQLEAMDNFVDNMDLMEAGDKDEEGNRGPWFETPLSYNPAIHRIKQAHFHALTSDLAINPLPPPHPELLKYWTPPSSCPQTITGCHRRDGHVHAKDDDDDIFLLDVKPRASRVKKAEPASSQSKAADETEDESEDEAGAKTKPTSTPPPKNDCGNPLPTPAPSLSPQINPGRAPKLMSRAARPRRKVELLEWFEVLRETCLKEDEIDAWNTFLKELCAKCTTEPGNCQFWDEVQRVGRKLSLISDQEA